MTRRRTIYRLAKKTGLAVAGLLLLILIIGFSIAVSREREILSAITKEINSRIRGEVAIGDLDFTMLERFPAFSARLNNISITDSLIQIHHDTLFRAKSVSFQINVLSLISGSIRFHSVKIKDAAVSVLTTKSGYCNSSLAKKRTDSNRTKASPDLLPVNRLIFEHVAVHIRDSAKMKFFGWEMRNLRANLESNDTMIFFRVNGSAFVEGLVFNAEKGGFFSGKEVDLNLKAQYSLQSKTLAVAYSPILLEKQPVRLRARFEMGEEPCMRLEFFSRSLLPSVAFPCLPGSSADRLAAYKLVDTVRMFARIEGSLKPGSKPAVDAYFKSYNNTLTVAKRSYEQLNLLGWYTNHVDSTKVNDDHNSKVMMPVFNGMLYGIPIKAQMTITDLVVPELLMKASVTYSKDAQGDITTERFRFTDGEISIQFMFQGPLVNYVDSANKKLLGQLQGEMFVQNAALEHIKAGYQFRNMNGQLRFDQTDLMIDTMEITVNGNRARISGDAKYFIAFLFIPSINAQVNLDVRVDTIDFNSFKKPGSLSQVQPDARKKPGREFVPSMIDWMTSHVELNLAVNAKSVLYKQLAATDVSGAVLITPDFMKINQASMSVGGGSVDFSASVEGLTKKEHSVDLKAAIKDADIHEVMYSFNNFGQDAITAENIFGTLNASILFSARLDEKYDVIRPTMQGSIKTTLKDGSLRNISTLQNISRYIFKNRDFSNIQFADMKNEFELDGTIINLNEVQIFSSVITLFVEGDYDFDRQKTDMLLTIPFSNLKRMDPEERISLAAETLKKGGNFKLRVVNGADGRLKLVPAASVNGQAKQKVH